MSDNTFFTFEHQDDGLAVITIDVPEESQNVLKMEFIEELAPVIVTMDVEHEDALVLGKHCLHALGDDLIELTIKSERMIPFGVRQTIVPDT